MKHLLGLLFLTTMSWAQSGPPEPPAAATAPAPAPRPARRPAVLSPEVHADRTVTFRLRDPNAQAVVLSLEGHKPAPMEKNEAGIWSVTTPPLDPDYYGYTFQADGVSMLDPGNSLF